MENNRFYQARLCTRLGDVTIICTDSGLAFLYFDNNKNITKQINNFNIINNANHTIIKQVEKWLADYFHGLKPDINTIPFDLTGSNFQLDVWKLLIEIPYGKTATYNSIAKSLALKYGIKKMSAQAVGTAIGLNPVSIIIPCHRVIGSNGSLAGYASGIEAKRKLLEAEGLKF